MSAKILCEVDSIVQDTEPGTGAHLSIILESVSNDPDDVDITIGEFRVCVTIEDLASALAAISHGNGMGRTTDAE